MSEKKATQVFCCSFFNLLCATQAPLRSPGCLLPTATGPGALPAAGPVPCHSATTQIALATGASAPARTPVRRRLRCGSRFHAGCETQTGPRRKDRPGFSWQHPSPLPIPEALWAAAAEAAREHSAKPTVWDGTSSKSVAGATVGSADAGPDAANRLSLPYSKPRALDARNTPRALADIVVLLAPPGRKTDVTNYGWAESCTLAGSSHTFRRFRLPGPFHGRAPPIRLSTPGRRAWRSRDWREKATGMRERSRGNLLRPLLVLAKRAVNCVRLHYLARAFGVVAIQANRFA
jgi:hypothetical protein